MELRHTYQTLEIDLDSMKNQNINLKDSLWDVEYKAQMQQLNSVLLTWSQPGTNSGRGQRQIQEYEALLNIKVKLEVESLNDALDSSTSMQIVQRTTTRKVVS